MGPPQSSHPTKAWGSEDAERHLRSLELFGMRFGLDRMRRMMTALGSPERRFAIIRVVEDLPFVPTT
jgi:dihydrofolate synthase/folylpolyglutamate synthase